MNKFCSLILSSLLTLFCACSAAPPSSYSVSHDKILNHKDGVLLLVDVCIQRDGIGDSTDYFVIDESKYAAQQLIDVLQSYLNDSEIPVRGKIQAVCAAKHGDKLSIRASQSFSAKEFDSEQPLYVDLALLDDADYISAISTISTYAFERAALTPSKSNIEATSANSTKSDFLKAASIVKDRTNASSIMFLGALGTSRTNAKATVGFIGNVVVGTVTAVLTAGLGTGYYIGFMPGQQVSGRILEAALIDLSSGELTWSNAVKAGGDPIDSETWLDPDPLDLLLHDLLFQQNTSNTQ